MRVLSNSSGRLASRAALLSQRSVGPIPEEIVPAGGYCIVRPWPGLDLIEGEGMEGDRSRDAIRGGDADYLAAGLGDGSDQLVGATLPRRPRPIGTGVFRRVELRLFGSTFRSRE